MVGLWSCIAIDSFDHPHISYMDYGNGTLKYARWDGSVWHVETVDYDSDPTVMIGFNTSIALDSGDFPHISYVWYKEIQEPPEPIDANSLKYARWDGSSWQIEFVKAGINLRGTSIKLDNYDNPRVAYVSNEGVLSFTWRGTSFNLLSPVCGETITTTEPTLDWGDCNLPGFINYNLWWGTDPNFGEYNEVTGIINSEHQITEGIEYGDTIYWRVKSIYYPNEYWAEEMDWYFDVSNVAISVPDAPGELVLYATYPNPSREVINFVFSLPEEGQVNIMLYDLLGRCVASPISSRMTAGRHEVLMSCSEIPPGVYLYNLETGYGCMTRRLVITH